MGKIKYFIIFLFLVVFLVYLPLFGQQQQQQQQETITITTYYPSPVGIYNRLVTNTLGVGDTNQDGDLNANDAPNPVNNPGNVWIRGSVGIGTTNPQARLDVNGNIRIGDDPGLNCNANTAGTLRYHNNAIEYCDGNNWRGVFLRMEIGSYIGDGVNGRQINLNFTPRFIAIYAAPYGKENPVQFYKTDSMPGRCAFFQGGLAAWNGYRDVIEIVNNGFRVYEQTGSCCSQGIGCNDLYGKSANLAGATYYYTAWGN